MGKHALVFTDIVDSTLQFQRLGEAEASRVMEEHDRHSRDLVSRHGGREIDRSDGFFLLFDGAVGAAAFALAYHARLAELQLRARVGLHVGAVLLRQNSPEHIALGARPLDVEGVAKPLAARVMSLARAGQTLLTAQACAELGDAFAERAQIKSHGHYRLKGIEEPIEVFELGARDESLFQPPEDAEKAYRVVRADQHGDWLPVREVSNNLPRERDAFVGRTSDLVAIERCLDSGARLLTLLGPGGTGKTRLIRRYGTSRLGDHPGGVYFCDLSEVRTLDGIFFVVAQVLDVQLLKDDPRVQLGHALAARGRCLVIFDNFEQVVHHAAESVEQWLDRAPQTAFVVTSRERLYLAGENVLPVAPLATDMEAIELFALRARSHRAEFLLTANSRPTVRQIVTLLDGLPLAIELAAARIAVMSPAQLLQRLGDRFRLLSARPGAGRQAALKSTIDWSWDLLAGWEQSGLAQCAVFEGGFTLDAAEATLDLADWPEAPPVVDLVRSLVDKSLLRTWLASDNSDRDDDEPYFGLYLTIHDYASEKLRSLGPAARQSAETRHMTYFAHLGSEELLGALASHEGGARRRALARDLDNVVAACHRAVKCRRATEAVSAFRAAYEVIVQRGPFELALQLGAAVNAIEVADPSLRAAALMASAHARLATGDTPGAYEQLETALTLSRQAGDRKREAEVLCRLGNAYRVRGQMEDARRHLEQAAAIGGEFGDSPTLGAVLAELGIIYRQTGVMDQASACFNRALAIDRAAGDSEAECKVLNNLGNLYTDQSRFVQAAVAFEQSLALSRQLGNRRHEALVLGNLATVELERGRLTEADRLYQEALGVHRATGERSEQGNMLGNLGLLRQRLGRMDDARDLFTSSLDIAREIGNRRNEGTALGFLGDLERIQGRFDEARPLIEQSLALHHAVGNRRFEAAMLARLGELLSQTGHRGEARVLFGEAETLMRDLNDRLELVTLCCFKGHLALAEGQLHQARSVLAEADELAAALGLEANSSTLVTVSDLRTAIASATS